MRSFLQLFEAEGAERDLQSRTLDHVFGPRNQQSCDKFNRLGKAYRAQDWVAANPK